MKKWVQETVKGKRRDYHGEKTGLPLFYKATRNKWLQYNRANVKEEFTFCDHDDFPLFMSVKVKNMFEAMGMERPLPIQSFRDKAVEMRHHRKITQERLKRKAVNEAAKSYMFQKQAVITKYFGSKLKALSWLAQMIENAYDKTTGEIDLPVSTVLAIVQDMRKELGEDEIKITVNQEDTESLKTELDDLWIF